MKFYTRKRQSPVVNIVSLIDILAILLIFFIVTTTFKKTQPQLEINLPESKNAAPSPEAQQQPILLAVKSAEEITLDDEVVALGELGTRLKALREASPERPVAMQADETAEFGVIVQVIDALKDAGVKNLPAFTKPPSAPVPSPATAP